MDDSQVVWDLEDDPDGNVRHIQERGITMDEVEDVLLDRDSQTAVSKSSGDPITFGRLCLSNRRVGCAHHFGL